MEGGEGIGVEGTEGAGEGVGVEEDMMGANRYE